MEKQGVSRDGADIQPVNGLRPTLMGTRHMIAAGHYLAAHAGFKVLEGGGNAIDAGVAAGIALGVVQSDLVNVAGVAPIIIYLAETREVVTISGLGHWPRKLPADLFLRDHGGRIPEGILRTVVPAAPDAWITALRRYGTISFAEAAEAAIRFARDGFIMYPLMADLIALHAEDYARWRSSAAIYLPGGRPPSPGERFVQADLARSLQHMADEERAAARRGREAGLQAARDAFYKGDIAAAILRYHRENGSYLDELDLAGFSAAVEPPVRTRFAGIDIYACGPWCQGPALLQALNLLDPEAQRAQGHNTSQYVHTIVEAMKLAFADRHHWYGDPRFVDVPIDALLSAAYAEERRALIRDDTAWLEMPPPGRPDGRTADLNAAGGPVPGPAAGPRDTSYVAVVDRHGNAFSATPSDVSFDTPVIPGTGLCPSSRGSQSWADPAHPAGVAPGKRPRLTPNPALAVKPDEWIMPFGTPGGDVQIQAMLQMFLNTVLFGMPLQEAVEAPRFATYSFPDSFEPHGYLPGRICLEGRIQPDVGEKLSALGHDVQWWPDWVWRAGAMCVVRGNLNGSQLSAGADPRRPCYAMGW